MRVECTCRQDVSLGGHVMLIMLRLGSGWVEVRVETDMASPTNSTAELCGEPTAESDSVCTEQSCPELCPVP